MVAATHALTDRTWPREVIAPGQIPEGPPARFGRGAELLGDAGMVVGLAYLLPFVIILVGAPLALTLKLLLWMGGVQ